MPPILEDEAKNPGKSARRITKAGRDLRYCLKVLQEPERARACGSGAKSSADRRPVDPPPVVQLKIYEINSEDGSQQDITFAYNANFFLFATLESARPMAHGRGQPVASTFPVLTGMPVSGMAYLDRPHEAGYFIFPDLSVRHEGRYFLSFNLYEQTKNDDDTTAGIASDEREMHKPPTSPDSSFDWRLEVQSQPFVVYSAKKFPGLHESTFLSKTVAEQGCRVRIRRDVRMRRRGDKGSDFNEDQAQDGEYSRAHTPRDHEPVAYRERSLSGSPSSPDGDDHTHASGHRQPVSHLAFEAERNAQRPQFAQPGQFPPGPPPARAPYHQSLGPYQPHQAPGPHQQPYNEYSRGPAPPQYAPSGPPPSPYSPYERPSERMAPYPQSAHPSDVPRRHEMMSDNRRVSFASFPPSGHSQHPAPLPSLQSRNPEYRPSAYSGPPLPSFERAPLERPLEPLRNHPMERAEMPQLAPLRTDSLRAEGHPGPSSPMRQLPSIQSPVYERSRERIPDRAPLRSSISQYPSPPPIIAAASPPPVAPEIINRNGKRTHDAVYRHNDEPLRNRKRPDTALEEVEPEEGTEAYRDMIYKRASGSNTNRPLPTDKEKEEMRQAELRKAAGGVVTP